ncbi:MAG: hypothetical protein IKA79_03880 [Lentisphaeria bacterium]|nr:hypothetical protein [Lentisphaeria bacterium]
MKNDSITAFYSANIPDDLSAKEWQKAKAEDLVWLKPDQFDRWSEERKQNVGAFLREKANVRLLWNEEYLAVGVSMEDTDIVAEGTLKDNQTLLYTRGDIVEIFVKPAEEPYYWELYGTPNELKSVLFYPSRGRFFVPSTLNQDPEEIIVKTRIYGTLNDWTKRDTGWDIVIKIPLAMLTRYGKPFKSGEWTIMAGRQNYSFALPMKEESCFPPLATSDFHNYEDYARLFLQ